MNPTPSNPAMNDTFLFEHFATLATAPDGIARLRELILQLAVQGKLGTQDAGDEPASVLLEKIRKEKERLIKKGEISKSRVLPEIESEEIPFHIPKNWVWLRLEDIGYSCGQKEPDKIFTYIDVTAINKERGLIGDEVNVLQPNEAPSRARKLVKKGTVIYSTVRPYLLNIAIVDKDFNPEPIVSTAFAVLHPFEGIFNRYLFYYLRSKPFVEYVESQMTGMAYPAINDQKFHMGLIPVPPTAEQHRIVAKVDRLMALCDELEARQQQERAGCLKLGTASLAGLQNAESPEEFGRQWAQVCDAFDLILDCPENVAVLRQSILQMAVQGRLVRQEPGDAPAIQIINKTKSESTKDQRHLKILRKDEVPFSIPDGWEWTRIRFIANVLGGLTKNAERPTYPKKLPYLRVANVQAGFLDLETIKEIGVEENEIPRYLLNDGDLLIVEGNGSINHIGRVALWNDEISPCLHQNHIIKIRFSLTEIGPYVMNWLLSTEGRNQITKVASTTSGLYTLNITKVSDLIIPLPPLAEQHRIVAKVDALMQLCDALESRLKERAATQEKFTNAIVKKVADA